MICQINTCNEKKFLVSLRLMGQKGLKKKSTTILFERIQTDQNEAF